MLYDIYYKALTWSQEISTSQGEATTLLRLKCVPKLNCELKLSTGGKLRDYEISMGIAPGEPLAEQLQGRNLQTDAVCREALFWTVFLIQSFNHCRSCVITPI
jgi:hypothetical protein